MALTDQRIHCHQRASLQGQTRRLDNGRPDTVAVRSNLFPTVALLSVGWAQRRKPHQLRRIMVFKFCEMPLSGRTQVSGTSNAERSYVDQHLWGQSLGFQYPGSLPEDTGRPTDRLPQGIQEGPQSPCLSNPCERAGELFSRGEGWNFSFRPNLLLKDGQFSLHLRSYLLVSPLQGKMRKKNKP